MVDPRYENFERIENGMTRSEVHDLMGWPPTNVSHWWPMKAHLRDEWRGTRGVIVIDFFGDEHVIRKTFHRANQ